MWLEHLPKPGVSKPRHHSSGVIHLDSLIKKVNQVPSIVCLQI